MRQRRLIKIDGLGLDMTPTSITAALRLNDTTLLLGITLPILTAIMCRLARIMKWFLQAVFIEDGTLMIPIRDSMEISDLMLNGIKMSFVRRLISPKK